MAADSGYQTVRKEMEARLLTVLTEQEDPRLVDRYLKNQTAKDGGLMLKLMDFVLKIDGFDAEKT